jgi:tRNA threonylcarbamoyladenosine biosynthesis protein TsaB
MSSPHSFILALSTSSGVAKVAAMRLSTQQDPNPLTLFNQGFVALFAFEIVDYKQQSIERLPALRQAMVDSGLEPQQCVAIAVDVGPGGFTSLRTACGVAQGLAVAWQLPCVVLTSFETMLAAQQLAGAPAQTTTCLLDARLNEIYCATLSISERETHWVQAPCLIPYQQQAAQAVLEQSKAALCDSGVIKLFEQQATTQTPVLQTANAHGLAALAWHRFLHQKTVVPFECQPLYVREKVAQTTSERMAAKDV